MDLYSISATALEVAEKCLVRYEAEKVKRAPQTGSKTPANKGSACHGALEDHVRKVYIEKDPTYENTLKNLLKLLDKYFEEIFGNLDKKSEDYKDCKEMLTKWFKRTDLSGLKVLSVEEHYVIEVPTSQGIKKFNYIWDRCDEFYEDGKLIIRVVDYKSWRKNLQPNDLHHKIQTRMYAMAASMKFKDRNPDEIWVQLDQLRWGNPESKFSVEENRETWKWMKKLVEKIIATDPSTLRPTLNDECGFCVLKTTCPELRKNAQAGGVWALMDDDQLARAQYELISAQNGAKYALEEIETIMSARMKNEDVLEWDTENFEVKFTSGRATRSINPRDVARIVGDDIFRTITKVNITTIDDLMKTGELTDEQCAALKAAMTRDIGASKPKATPKGSLPIVKPSAKSGGMVALEAL